MRHQDTSAHPHPLGCVRNGKKRLPLEMTGGPPPSPPFANIAILNAPLSDHFLQGSPSTAAPRLAEKRGERAGRVGLLGGHENSFPPPPFPGAVSGFIDLEFFWMLFLMLFLREKEVGIPPNQF